MSVIKDQLRHLVDMLPEEEVQTAVRFLQFLIVNKKNAWEAFLKNPPMSDEGLTDDEIMAIAEAQNDITKNQTKSWDQVKEELGL